MNAKDAYEKMVAAQQARTDKSLGPVLTAIEEAVNDGEPRAYWYDDLDDGTVAELRRRGFTMIRNTHYNETTWTISWPNPEGE